MLALQVVVGAHLALLFLWLPRGAASLATPQAREAGDRGATVTLYRFTRTASASPAAAVKPASAPASAPDIADPTEPIAHPEDLGLPAPRTDLAPDQLVGQSSKSAVETALQSGQPGVSCNLAVALQAQLQGNRNVAAALASIPRRSRSVANAIMMWDGGWVATGSPSGDTALAALRSAIVEALQTTPPDCQAATNLGPILIPIIDERGATVLALGSGSWRASDVIDQGAGGVQTFP